MLFNLFTIPRLIHANIGNYFIWQFNFVGRILGPRGNSLKRVEATTGCRVLIRGRGSIKDTAKVSVILKVAEVVIELVISNFAVRVCQCRH